MIDEAPNPEQRPEVEGQPPTEPVATEAVAPPAAGPAPPAGEPTFAVPFEPLGEGEAPIAGIFPPERPELAVGAAFAGGFLLAILLRRLGR